MSERYQITVSDQADDILRQLTEFGIYGRTVPEVIKRIVDAKLASMFGVGSVIEATRVKK